MIVIGDDWAEDHHDVYLMDEAGRRLASRRLPEGLTGIRQLHELVAAHAEEPDQAVDEARLAGLPLSGGRDEEVLAAHSAHSQRCPPRV